MDPFQEGAKALRSAAATMEERNAAYKATDRMHADAMAVLLPEVALMSAEDHRRFSMFNMMIIKLTRYAANWSEGHDDSLTDLINYTAALQAIDRERMAGTSGEVLQHLREPDPEAAERARRDFLGRHLS